MKEGEKASNMEVLYRAGITGVTFYDVRNQRTMNNSLRAQPNEFWIEKHAATNDVFKKSSYLFEFSASDLEPTRL